MAGCTGNVRVRDVPGGRLAVDGIFGDDTFRALRTAQNRAGVTPDGAYGPATAGAMSFRYRYVSSDVIYGCASGY